MNFLQKLTQRWKDNKPLSKDEEFALVQENKRLEEALKELSEPKLLKMEQTEEGLVMDFAMGQGIASKIAEGLRACLDEIPGGPAENYVEWVMAGPAGPRYVMNLRRLEGKTPADLQKAAEAERDALRKERDDLLIALYRRNE